MFFLIFTGDKVDTEKGRDMKIPFPWSQSHYLIAPQKALFASLMRNAHRRVHVWHGRTKLVLSQRSQWHWERSRWQDVRSVAQKSWVFRGMTHTDVASPQPKSEMRLVWVRKGQLLLTKDEDELRAWIHRRGGQTLHTGPYHKEFLRLATGR